MPFPRIREPQSPAETAAMTPDENMWLTVQRHEESARVNLVQCLILMGRFEEALTINENPEQEVLIAKYIKAESREDDHRCKCVATIDVTDWTRYAALPEEAKAKIEPVLIQTPNYIRTFRHWSDKYNSMAWFYQCSICGCVQTLPEGESISDINTSNYEDRYKAHQDALNSGIKVRIL